MIIYLSVLMKRFTYTLMLAAMCLPAAFGATPEQMDRARAIAYKYCLRYMNNGSGYLDDKKPKSTAELKSALKEKEKENIKVLEKISIPSESEYATWDKEEFNKFWKDTFFSNKSLKFNAKGACKATAAGEISKISVTAAEPSATKPKPEEQAKAEEKTAAPAEITVSADDEAMSPLVEEPAITPVEEVQPVEMPVEDVKPSPEPKKESSNTWAIIVLCTLIIVVGSLVVYALNVMKRNKERQNHDMPRRTKPRREAYREPEEEDNGYTSTADPEDESAFASYAMYEEPEPQRKEPEPIRRPAQRSMAAVSREHSERDMEIERLRAEVAALRQQLSDSHDAANVSSRYTPGSRTQRPAHVIYLAQANANGVFTRADARYNVGNSIFKLVTTDGVSGSFTVIDDPTVHELALMMPTDFLVNACSGRNMQQTHCARSIINEAAGTAIFEDGRWYVTRRAQIRYSR